MTLLLLGTCDIMAQNDLEFKKEGEIHLSTEISGVLQSTNSAFYYFDDLLYITSDNPAQLIIYNLSNGENVLFKRLAGRGPGEFQNLYDIHVNSNGIYLIDYSGKVAVYDHTFELVNEIVLDVVRTKDLIMVQDDLYVAAESPTVDNYLLIVDNSGSVKETGPEQMPEYILNSVYKESGSLYNSGSRLYVVPPFGQTLYILESSEDELLQRSRDLNIPDFREQKAERDMQFYFSNSESLIELFRKNSLITHFQSMDEGYITEVLHIHDNHRRDIILFDSNLDVTCSATLPRELDGVRDPKVHFSDSEYLYFYREEIHDDSEVKAIVSYYTVSCR